jgi:hypothetical protein
VVRGAERQPPDVLDARGLERVQRVLDVLRVLVLVVVVPDGHDDVRAELRPHRLDELDDVRRADAADRAAVLIDAAARRDFEVEIDPLTKDRDGLIVARNGIGDRVADQRHVLKIACPRLRGGAAESERQHQHCENPPHAHDRSGALSIV